MINKKVRYDETLKNELVRAAEQKRLEEEKALEEAANANVGNGVAEGEADYSEVTVPTGNEAVKTWDIPIEQYSDVVHVEVRWTLTNSEATLELFTPDGASYITPDEQDFYSAKFNFYNAPAGVYTLKILNYQGCGEISVVPTAEVPESSSNQG